MGYFIKKPLFTLGHLLISEEVEALGHDITRLLERHQSGDFGSACAHDATENHKAIEQGEEVISQYKIQVADQELLLVIMTEADRSYTVVFILDETKLESPETGGNPEA